MLTLIAIIALILAHPSLILQCLIVVLYSVYSIHDDQTQVIAIDVGGLVLMGIMLIVVRVVPWFL